MPISSILKYRFNIHVLTLFKDLKYEMLKDWYKLQSKFTTKRFKNKTEFQIALNFYGKYRTRIKDTGDANIQTRFSSS